MDVEKYAKEGLSKLAFGSPEITLSAKTVGDLRFLSAFYLELGYDVESERGVSKEGKLTSYPINIFVKNYSGGNQDA